MLRRLTALAIVLAFVGGSMYGQGAHPGGTARMLSMGGAPTGANAVFNPFIFSDPSWQQVNPAWATMYKDYAWSNVAGGTLQNASFGDNGYGNQYSGVNFGFGKEWTFGAVLSYDPSAVRVLYQPNILPAPYNNGLLQTFINQYGGARPVGNFASTNQLGRVEVFEALAAYHMGSMDLGFGLLYGWTGRDAKTTTTTPVAGTFEGDLSAHVFGLRGGILLDLGGGSAVDGSVALRMDKADDKEIIPGSGAGTGTSEYSASATEIQLALRAKLKASNKVNFVPYGAFVTASSTPKEDAIVTGATGTRGSLKFSATNLVLGAGGEYHTSSFYLAGGLSFATLSQKAENNTGAAGALTWTTTQTLRGFPVFNLGAEWWFTDWLAGRWGYYRAFVNTNVKDENDPGFPAGQTTTETDVFGGNSFVTISGYGVGDGADPSLVTLGVGLKFGSFALDATVSETALRKGLGLIGQNDNINTFGYITLSYSFE